MNLCSGVYRNTSEESQKKGDGGGGEGKGEGKGEGRGRPPVLTLYLSIESKNAHLEKKTVKNEIRIFLEYR